MSDEFRSWFSIIVPPYKNYKLPILCLLYFVANIVLYYLVRLDKFDYCPFLPPSRDIDEWWKYISSMFLHVDEIHLWMNMIMLLFLGIPFEVIHGSIRFFIVSFVGGVTGILYEQALFHMDNKMYLLGSSSAVYGLGGSYLSTLLLNYNQMGKVFILLSCLSLFILILQTVVDSTIIRTGRIAHIAHASSFLQGFLVNGVVGVNIVNERLDTIVFFLCLFSSVVMILASLPLFLLQPIVI